MMTARYWGGTERTSLIYAMAFLYYSPLGSIPTRGPNTSIV